jgi:hypothetical protein
MEGRSRLGAGKRVFGRDITNIERRGKVHSISEKPLALQEHRKPSRSFEKKASYECKDSINEYEQEILAFMLSIQVLLLLVRPRKRKNCL